VSPLADLQNIPHLNAQGKTRALYFFFRRVCIVGC
jgi:hypothetical protein